MRWHNRAVPATLRILGIDPGLNRTGYGVIDVAGSRLSCVDSGTIRVPGGDLYQRLGAILDALSDVIRATHPHVATVEKVFVNVNPQTTLMLGQARGAAICAAASSGLVVHEYAALQIKQAVVGFGQADKRQVQSMVQRLLGLSRAPGADAADALACAICHAHASTLLAVMRGVTAATGAGAGAPPRRRSAAAGRRAWTARLQGAK
jgi:crossover junction endodeoxyribonuclease RuvC